MSKVGIFTCPEYDVRRIKNIMKENLGQFQVDERLIRGKKVLLKPNVLSGQPPEAAVTTHPAFVEGVATVFRDMGGEVAIGDSSGGAMGGHTITNRALKKSGIAGLSEKGFEVVNFDSFPPRLLPSPSKELVDDLYVSPSVLDCDFLVSLPKLKTHVGTLYTGAIKNLFGCVPGQVKGTYHYLAPKGAHLSSIFVDLLQIIKPHLVIMDGVLALEGNGPGKAGRARDVGLLFMGSDSVALDAVVSTVIGLEDPLLVPTTRIAYERGLGEADLAKIEIVGETIESVRISDFEIPRLPERMSRYFPDLLFRVMVGLSVRRPRPRKKLCTACGLCGDSCPVKAIYMEDSVAVVDYRRCVYCMCCLELCPEGAIKLERRSALARALRF
jgi:uncharacterized protein (DUF362 family)/Pyruvate/2-oxoacid:ferredoxin oxidoreductase delta subunit